MTPISKTFREWRNPLFFYVLKWMIILMILSSNTKVKTTKKGELILILR
ncbi:hypothetical protein BTBSAS_240005 [Brochothrix thermosphacta]|uniref:Uncharacterized protein n=1 Tax=Brochothrix thermosphacta TaxID=2756 RepID=A0A2X0QJ03_BROTH|nr:hypothetical protein BTBSAS_240005 [Brochothrix thermosphacta]